MLTRLAVVVVAALGCAVGCGAPLDAAPAAQVARGIVGGEAASTAELPNVAFLYFTKRAGNCTGTLIDDDIVLTAGHCLDPTTFFPPFASDEELLADLHVLFGADNVIFPPADAVDVGAVDFARHPAWDASNTGDNDVGVVFLDTPIAAAPALMNTDAGAVPLNALATLVGYGVDENADQSVLRVVRDKPIAACFGDNPELVCFDQTDGSGICAGDSGGPAFLADGTIGGVASFGDAGCSQFGAFTRIDRELDFLDEAVCVADVDAECTPLCNAAPFTPEAGCAAGEGEGEGDDDDGGDPGLSCTSTPWSVAGVAALLAVSRRRRRATRV